MKQILLDTRQGGLGDVWMRLAGLFSLAALVRGQPYAVKLPAAFEELGQAVFGDRLHIHDGEAAADYTYTSLGARSLRSSVWRGQRFVTPYSSFASTDSQRHPMVDGLNQAVIAALEAAGLVRSPQPSDIHRYQAFSDIAPFASDAGISYPTFLQQAERDFQIIRQRLLQPLAHSPEFGAGEAATAQPCELLVFPSGTSRQCIPAHWAAQHLRHASHAFFFKDPLKNEYERLGLHCVNFYSKPGDMVALARQAKWSISTDTFSSHVLQYLTDQSTVLLTELTSVRVVSPFYRGQVVNSQVPCHPCKKVVRTPGSRCQAGHTECLNWTYPQYAQDTLRSISFEASR